MMMDDVASEQSNEPQAVESSGSEESMDSFLESLYNEKPAEQEQAPQETLPAQEAKPAKDANNEFQGYTEDQLLQLISHDPVAVAKYHGLDLDALDGGQQPVSSPVVPQKEPAPSVLTPETLDYLNALDDDTKEYLAPVFQGLESRFEQLLENRINSVLKQYVHEPMQQEAEARHTQTVQENIGNALVSLKEQVPTLAPILDALVEKKNTPQHDAIWRLTQNTFDTALKGEITNRINAINESRQRAGQPPIDGNKAYKQLEANKQVFEATVVKVAPEIKGILSSLGVASPRAKSGFVSSVSPTNQQVTLPNSKESAVRDAVARGNADAFWDAIY